MPIISPELLIGGEETAGKAGAKTSISGAEKTVIKVKGYKVFTAEEQQLLGVTDENLTNNINTPYGTVTAPPGSEAAKVQWKLIEQKAKAAGEYTGGSLDRGADGSGRWNLMVDRLQATRGVSQSSAEKIAGSIKTSNISRYGTPRSPVGAN